MKQNYFFSRLAAIVLLTAVTAMSASAARNGALSGRFTINANGDQVVFSQGNLQFQTSTNTYRFALNQYDYVGSGNELTSIGTKEGWMDTFCWGTGDNPLNTSVDTNSVFVDWGINAISNGGNTPNQWRTLTAYEWFYITYYRNNANTLFSLAKVNGVNGMILLPDTWTIPSGLSFTAISAIEGIEFNANYGTYSYYGGEDIYKSNIYTTAEWSQMEAAGAVFLPAWEDLTAGNSYIAHGVYWSSGKYTGTQFLNDYIGLGMWFNSTFVYLYTRQQNIPAFVRLTQPASRIDTELVETIDTVTTVTFAESLTEETNLQDTIINDFYYNITDGEYDKAEGCIVINSATIAEYIEDAEIGSAAAIMNLNGMMFTVDSTFALTIDYQTIGNGMLVVQIGESIDTISTDTRDTETLECDLHELATAFIYMVDGTPLEPSDAPRRVKASVADEGETPKSAVKLWGIKIEPKKSSGTVTAIEEVGTHPSSDAASQAHKVFDPATGAIYILRDGKAYNILGAEMK